MKHSKEELKLFQSFPLDVKMGKTALRIRELAEHDFYVSFSGGKDSEVAVDFVARTLSEIGIQQMYVANVNTGLEYLSVQRFCKPFCEMVSKKYGIKIILDTLYPKITFKAVLEKYGYPIISKEVAQCIFEARKGIANGDGTYSYRIQKLNGTYKDKNGNLSPYNCSKYKFLLDAPFKISHLCCHEMKKHPAYEYEALTGRIPLIATTTEESRARKSAWLKHGCNVFDAKRPLSAPFSFWTDNDILTYIHQENLPVADAYGKVVPEDDGIDGLNKYCPEKYEYSKKFMEEHGLISDVIDDETGEKYDPKDFVIETCPVCGREEVIRIKGVSRCRCGYPLAPCSVCESCDYATCPYGCNGTEEDTEKPCDHDALPDSIQEKLYALL